MPLKNSYWPLLLASLSDGSCRIAVNRRHASFDGNACDLAILCTLSCRNTPGGPPRTFPLSSYTEEAATAALLLWSMLWSPVALLLWSMLWSPVALLL
jgi:hypothetical protein